MNEINLDSILNELKKDVAEAIEKASKDTASEGVKQLKNKSPKRTGEYAKGWGQSKQKDKIVLHNRKKPGLTHLLENDHALRDGGRSTPQKHIEPVDEFVQEELERRIIQALS